MKYLLLVMHENTIESIVEYFDIKRKRDIYHMLGMVGLFLIAHLYFTFELDLVI